MRINYYSYNEASIQHTIINHELIHDDNKTKTGIGHKFKQVYIMDT